MYCIVPYCTVRCTCLPRFIFIFIRLEYNESPLVALYFLFVIPHLALPLNLGPDNGGTLDLRGKGPWVNTVQLTAAQRTQIVRRLRMRCYTATLMSS
jgi:hypothetical protein